MGDQGGLSRRRFMKAAGMLSLVTPSVVYGKAASFDIRRRSHFAFVGSKDSGVQVYRTDRRAWTLLQTVQSAVPVSLILHPGGRILYVLNEVADLQGMPRGSVEAYSIGQENSRLTLLSREPLSLSAIMPRAMALSPTGDLLVVAVNGGGSYNALPIRADGGLDRVCAIHKEIGSGPVPGHQESAHPQSVLFDGTGRRCFSTDLGCDRVSLFSLQNGFEVLARYQTRSGSGPRHLTVHPNGSLLFVSHALDESISVLHFNETDISISEIQIKTDPSFSDGLLMDRSGRFLFSAGGGDLVVWRVNTLTGALDKVSSQKKGRSLSGTTAQGLAHCDEGLGLLALTSNGILRFGVDPLTGSLGEARVMAVVQDARSVATL